MKRLWFVLVLVGLTACGSTEGMDMKGKAPEPNYEVIELPGVRCVVTLYRTQNQPVSCKWDEDR